MVERFKPRLEVPVSVIRPVKVETVNAKRAVGAEARKGGHRWLGGLFGAHQSREVVKAKHTPHPDTTTSVGRLILALGATQSRAGSWNEALKAQSALFQAVAAGGNVAVSLACYSDGPLQTSTFTRNPDNIEHAMRSIRIAGGGSQVGQVFDYAMSCAAGWGAVRWVTLGRLRAVVLIADCCVQEWRELQRIGAIGRRLGRRGCRTFIVHHHTGCCCGEKFAELASLAGGTFSRLEGGAPGELAALFGAIGAYAGGGLEAMREQARATPGAAAAGLVRQLEGFKE